MRIGFAAGYTAGHVHPALAVADALRERAPDVDVLFIGTAGGPEATLVPAAGFPFATIAAAPLFGAGAAGAARAIVVLAGAVARARRLLADAGVDAVVGFGGHVSAATVLAARLQRLPVGIHEANAIPGRTNRALARVAQRIWLSTPACADALPGRHTEVTGTPVRGALVRRLQAAEDDAKAPPFRILVAGGSRASAFLNAAAPPMLAHITAAGVPLAVLHQAGREAAGAVRDAYRAHGIAADVEEWIADMADAYVGAHLVICPAGASTLAEVALAGRAAFLVPLTACADDHQARNAAAFAAATGTPWVTEAAWTPDDVGERIATLLRNPAARRDLAARVASVARPLAADDVARGCLELADAVSRPASRGSGDR